MHAIRTLAALAASAALVPAAASARQAGITRHDLLRAALSAPGREVVQVLVEFAPGAVAPAHSHPGEEIVYVVRGALEYEVEGRQPVILRAGDVLFIPAEAAHRVTNVGSDVGAELATYVVELGKPLSRVRQGP